MPITDSEHNTNPPRFVLATNRPTEMVDLMLDAVLTFEVDLPTVVTMLEAVLHIDGPSAADVLNRFLAANDSDRRV